MLDKKAETAYNRWLRYVKPHSRKDWWFCGQVWVGVSMDTGIGRLVNWTYLTPDEACRWGCSDQVLREVNMHVLSMEIEL